MPRVISMDITRCVDCRSCEVACEHEHHGRANMFVQVIDERYAIPANCRHCEGSPCVESCPTGAIARVNEDVVAIASMKCIGCHLCTIACPFGAIWFDALNKVSRKCDLCLHRLERGLEPACVTTCSARALSFGDMDQMVAAAKQRGQHTVVTRASGNYGTIVSIPLKWNGRGG
jgi:formate dehydrogenase iron-sulfur subunit